MNLVRDKSRDNDLIRVLCFRHDCPQPNRLIRLSDAWVDLDGPAFRAYYHAQCVPCPAPKKGKS